MSTEFAPDKKKEEAIAAIIGCSEFVLVTETKIDSTPEQIEDGATDMCEWLVRYNGGVMGARGLLQFGSEVWKKNIIDGADPK